MGKHTARVSRRTFLNSAGSALAASAALGLPRFVPSRVLGAPGQAGANNRIVIGHIGVGGMGSGHLDFTTGRANARGDVAVAAVCDADEKRLAAALNKAGPKSTPYRDYRALLERKDIDAVIIATPDHWHGVQTVHAAECGKHVYVEKPACCTIEEGKAMVAAANNNRVAVQVGSQGRSQRDCYLAHLYLANGMLGAVRKVTCWHYASPVDNKPLPDSNPPPELDWDLWLGPMRWRPYNPRYCHGTFRWIMESGGGQIRDRGAHVMSCALHLMNADYRGPVSVEAKGTLPTKGLWDTAIDMEVVYEFKNPDWTLVWAQPGNRVPYENEERKHHSDYGAVYQGDKDTLVLWGGDGGTWTEPKAQKFEKPAGGVDVQRSPGFSHHEDWFEGIRTGRRTIMNIEAGVRVADLCILGNLSLVLGRKLQWNPEKREIVGDDQARRLMSRPQRYPYCL